MEKNRELIKKQITSIFQEMMGLSKRQNKKWIAIHTLGTIQQRKNKNTLVTNSRKRMGKAKAQAEYTLTNEQLMMGIKAHMWMYVKDLETTVK